MRTMVLAIVLSTAMAGPALARRGRGGGGEMGGFHPVRIEAVAARLGVSDAVLAQIKELSFKSEQEAIGIKAELDREHLELRRLMDADSPDEKAVMRQIDKVVAQESRMRKNRVHMLLEVRKLLTPEQRSQLGDLMSEWRGRGGKGGGGPNMGGGMGPGGRGMAPDMGLGPRRGRMGRF